MLEWVAISCSKGSSQPRDQTQVSRIADRFFTICATRTSLSSGLKSVFLIFLLSSLLKSLKIQLSSVQFSRSVVSDSLRPHESQHARPLSITNSRSSLRLMSIESVMPSSHLILCHFLLLLPPIPPSIRVFSNESTLHEVAKILE